MLAGQSILGGVLSSAQGFTTVVVADAVLLSGFGSVDMLVTLAVFVIVAPG